jgi:CubicO group peptidase (beta-lactamase class C family)
MLQGIATDQRAPILRRYLQRARGARAHIPVDHRAPLEAFEPIAAQYQERHHAPGSARPGVTADGQVEFVISGVANVRTLRPVTTQTTFLWFSMTKIVTATAAMMLADWGTLDLDAPIIEHVPETGVREKTPAWR